jgi:hypothetical protein
MMLLRGGSQMQRTHLVHVRVSAEEKRQLDEEAIRRGVSREAILRAGLVLVGGRLPKQEPTSPADKVPAYHACS